MRDDDGREYSAKIVWRKAREYYAKVGLLNNRYSAEEIIRNKRKDLTWESGFLHMARLRAEIEDLRTEIATREHQLEQLTDIAFGKD